MTIKTNNCPTCKVLLVHYDGCLGYESLVCPICHWDVNDTAAPNVGQRVRLTVDVERYPHFIAPKGAMGTITEVADDHTSVKLDQYLDGCEEWDNNVIWQDEERDYFTEQTEMEGGE